MVVRYHLNVKMIYFKYNSILIILWAKLFKMKIFIAKLTHYYLYLIKKIIYSFISYAKISQFLLDYHLVIIFSDKNTTCHLKVPKIHQHWHPLITFHSKGILDSFFQKFEDIQIFLHNYFLSKTVFSGADIFLWLFHVFHLIYTKFFKI